MRDFQTDEEAYFAALKLRSDIAGTRVLVAALRLQLLLGKANFDPKQPRVPRGRGLESGRWTRVGGSRLDRTMLAQAEHGILLGEAIVHPSRGGGKDCFYRFSYGIVAIPWSASFPCAPTQPWFAVTHGRLIKRRRLEQIDATS